MHALARAYQSRTLNRVRPTYTKPKGVSAVTSLEVVSTPVLALVLVSSVTTLNCGFLLAIALFSIVSSFSDPIPRALVIPSEPAQAPSSAAALSLFFFLFPVSSSFCVTDKIDSKLQEIGLSASEKRQRLGERRERREREKEGRKEKGEGRGEMTYEETESCADCCVIAADDTFDKQVWILESELWRAVSAQEEATNMLCTSIASKHLEVSRETHRTLDGCLDAVERQELQLRELAVLDEFQRRIQEATKDIQKEKVQLEETVQAKRDAFAEDLKKNLEETKRQKERELIASGLRSSKRKRNGGVLRSFFKLVHRVVIAGFTVLLAKEALKTAKKKSGSLIRKRRVDEQDTVIHTLPRIAIPQTGTRDTLMEKGLG